MKLVLLSIFIFSFHSVVAQYNKTVIIEPESTFTLSGVSNVNQFNCTIVEGFCGESLNVCYQKDNANLTFDNAKFSIEVAKFDCKSNYITRDMKKTLKHDQYPEMQFQLLNINNFNPLKSDGSKAEALITISGSTKKYLLDYHFSKTGENTYRINLSSDFDVNDFEITPPTALMGLIKVDETISVEINLSLTFIEKSE